ncbi:Adenylyl cyclase-associated protein [Fasciola hepatica]|uniref:Adenylyl cyclase-associated protein n=1 Tax=Fasciola hepatica TaxID=6192 RepID=A0A4E0R7Z4_FASHE|nr:Adenylyl cyclase-associated protein [Fasciola hepatica]
MPNPLCLCFPRRKDRVKVTSNNEAKKPLADGKQSESNESLESVRKPSVECDMSMKDAVSQSAESQNYAGSVDNASASLGGWSTVHPTASANVSNVNLVPSESSSLLLQSIATSLMDHSKMSEEYAGRLEALISRLEILAGVRPTASPAGLAAFKLVLDETLPAYVALSAELDRNLSRQASSVTEAFKLVLDLINTSTIYSKPKPSLMEEYLKPLSYKFMEIADFYPDVDPITRTELRTVAESILVLAWCNCPAASSFVKEIVDSTNAYANKVYQTSISNRQQHADWIRSWMACLHGVQSVVEEHFPHGLSWRPNGPEPPMPRKPAAPHLKYDRIDQMGTEKPISPKKIVLVSKCPNEASSAKSHAEILAEIARCRRKLRHVHSPDLI